MLSSTLLILQAILPFLLYAGTEDGEPIEVGIEGGTNVAWSLSWEYLDQVLLVQLQRMFGVVVERKLLRRGWSSGPPSTGKIWLKFVPLRPGQMLVAVPEALSPGDGREGLEIDMTIVCPLELHNPLHETLLTDLRRHFPNDKLSLVQRDDSSHPTRRYVLLVAKHPDGRIWGRDQLNTGSVKNQGKPKAVAAEMSRRVTSLLVREIQSGGQVDEFLQDQILVYQALASGRTRVSHGDSEGGSRDIGENKGEKTDERLRRDKDGEPWGDGSLHSKTVRWVLSEMIPAVAFYNGGGVVDGIGFQVAPCHSSGL